MERIANSMRIPAALILISSALFCLGNSGPMDSGVRKQNKESNVTVSYEREGTGRYFPGVVLSVESNQKQFSKLRLTNCLEFFDAKLDKQLDNLAVVFFDGIWLVYHRYGKTNRHWQLEQAVRLVGYNLTFTLFGNRLELYKIDTLRVSFIRGGEAFGRAGRQRGVEQAGDKVYFIRVTEGGEVLINGRKRESLQWRPDIGK